MLLQKMVTVAEIEARMINKRTKDALAAAKRTGKRLSRDWLTPKPPRDLDVAAIRRACKDYGYGQSTFAGVLGVSVRTLQGWEQGRRKPTGPARALLLVIASNPGAYIDAIAAWHGE